MLKVAIVMGSDSDLPVVRPAAETLEKLGIPFVYREGPGTHEWGFWDRYIQEILAWLPIRK